MKELRSLAAELVAIVTEAGISGADDGFLLPRVEELVRAKRRSQPVADDATRTARQWYRKWQEFGQTEFERRILTGTPLDEFIEGIYPGELILLLGRWGTAKTTTGAHIAKEMLCQAKPVLYLSLEVPGIQMFGRFLQAMGQWSAYTLRQRSGDAAVSEIVDLLEGGGLILADEPAITVAGIGEEIERANGLLPEEKQIACVIVDHADFVEGGGGGGKNEAEVIRDRYKGLKQLAKSADVVILSLHQALDAGDWYRMPTSRSSKGPVECADLAIGLLRNRAEDSPDLFLDLIKSRRSTLGTTAMQFLGPTQELRQMDLGDRRAAVEGFLALRQNAKGDR